MTEEEYKAILQEAIRWWGRDSRFELLIEECAELIVAIQHWKRDRCGVEKVIEEMADVIIMLDQIKIALCCNEVVDEFIKKKTIRLYKRIRNRQPSRDTCPRNPKGWEFVKDDTRCGDYPICDSCELKPAHKKINPTPDSWLG